jgi:NADH-quinone oxidoreductase subunit K
MYGIILGILDVYDDLMRWYSGYIIKPSSSLFIDVVETSTVMIGICIVCMFMFGVNMIMVLVSIELILLGVNIQLVSYSLYFDDLVGQFLALIVLTVAAAESAIGLGIVVVYYRMRGNVLLSGINMIHG